SRSASRRSGTASAISASAPTSRATRLPTRAEGADCSGASETVASASKEVAVAIMAKAPRPGTVKTRLWPPLVAAEAAALYRCCLLDKIATVGALGDARPVIAYSPDDARDELGGLAPGFTLVAQHGPDLGARLHATLAGLLAAGHVGAIAVDSDTPTLPSAFLQPAVDCPSRPRPHGVLRPTQGGGYYLIGGPSPHPPLVA